MLHADFARAVRSIRDPKLRVEFERSFAYRALDGQLGSVRNDVELINPLTGEVLAVFDYKTTADPDLTPGDMLSLRRRRAEDIRRALSKDGTVVGPSVPIVGMRVIVGGPLLPGR